MFVNDVIKERRSAPPCLESRRPLQPCSARCTHDLEAVTVLTMFFNTFFNMNLILHSTGLIVKYLDICSP